ncbi:MAG TPA: hypothetical protein VFB67_10355 [Candidatus Polarisedimenticolaceae bacterium]|nr:hypothetical protein [Candidatus Polarisedimenticolaceae bacterium]
MDDRHLAQELSDQDRLLLVFSYLGPLALFALVAGRKEFVKWHARQGALLSLAVAVLWIGARGAYLLVRAKLWPLLGGLFWVAAAATGLGVALLIFLCIVRALEGERFKVPLLGDLADAL